MSIPAKPWNTDLESFPTELSEAQGMIGPEERRCFYWLANTQLNGKGCVVDAGSFVGASTLCFAAGAANAGRTTYEGRRIVHAYDYFKAVDEYVAKFIRNRFRPIEKNESYLDVFEAQTAKYKDMITAHPGNFLEQTWCGDPIEILFIDIAKTAALNSHAIAEFFPHLIPGKSIVVHQDYFHCWHPYIHVAMEYFSDEFELVDEHVEFQSRVWRLMKPLSPKKIARMKAYDFTAAERMALLDCLVEKSSDHSRPMMEVVRLWQRCIDKDRSAIQLDIARFRSKYAFDERIELWARQAVMVERYYRERIGVAAG
jgi:predicted O-methyltransferase YrrM